MTASEQEVHFRGDLGDLVGVLRLPAGAAPDAAVPVIICCAGMSLTREVWLPAHAERFVAAGFATLSA